MDVVQLIADFGFPVVMVVGLGYFVYFVWQTITNIIDPAIQEMKGTIIRLTDQLRLLDQDMIRLQQKVNTVLELKEENKLNNGGTKEKKRTSEQSGTQTKKRRS
jgi:prefoldin subunit 5